MNTLRRCIAARWYRSTSRWAAGTRRGRSRSTDMACRVRRTARYTAGRVDRSRCRWGEAAGRRRRRTRWEGGTGDRPSRTGRCTAAESCRSTARPGRDRSLACTRRRHAVGSRSRRYCRRSHTRGRPDRSRQEAARRTCRPSRYRCLAGTRRTRPPGNRRHCCRFRIRDSGRWSAPLRLRADTAAMPRDGPSWSRRRRGARPHGPLPWRPERRIAGTERESLRCSSRIGCRRRPERPAAWRGRRGRRRTLRFPERRSPERTGGVGRQPEADG